MPNSSVTPLAWSQRDPRLDFWRGLCLIDMLLVHLVYEGLIFPGFVGELLGQWMRFAAGGFIFVAGLSIAVIYLPRMRDPARRRSARQGLGRRAIYLLLVHYAASLSFVLVSPLREYYGPFPSTAGLVLDVLLLRQGNDLLLFYVVMVALCPLLLELLRGGRTTVLLVGVCVIAFALGSAYPDALTLSIQHNFPVVTWQALFVAGMIVGKYLPGYDALSRRRRIATTAGSSLALLVLSALAFGGECGWGFMDSAWLFSKSPLSALEALRYLLWILTLMGASDLLWSRIRSSGLVALAGQLGRKSLAVYIAHVWVVALIIAVAWRVPGWGPWQGLLALAAIVLLWGWARWLEQWEQWRRNERLFTLSEMSSRLRGLLPDRATAGICASAGVAMAMMLSVHRMMPAPVMESPLHAVVRGAAIAGADDAPGFEVDANTDILPDPPVPLDMTPGVERA